MVIKIIALLLAIFGLLMTTVGLSELFTKSPINDKMLLGTIIFGFIPLAAGTFWYLKAKKSSKLKNENVNIKRILTFAKNNSGLLTIADTAIQLDITVEDTKNLLDMTVVKGLSDIEILDEGIVQYRFREFVKKIGT